VNEEEYNEFTRLKSKSLNGNQTIKQALRYYELKKLDDKNDTITKTWSIYDKKEKSYE